MWLVIKSLFELISKKHIFQKLKNSTIYPTLPYIVIVIDYLNDKVGVGHILLWNVLRGRVHGFSNRKKTVHILLTSVTSSAVHYSIPLRQRPSNQVEPYHDQHYIKELPSEGPYGPHGSFSTPLIWTRHILTRYVLMKEHFRQCLVSKKRYFLLYWCSERGADIGIGRDHHLTIACLRLRVTTAFTWRGRASAPNSIRAVSVIQLLSSSGKNNSWISE